MLSANADVRVLGYLGRALSLELSAVQLYSTQAKLVETWGLTEVAKRFGNEASEELGHAERIISRMITLGVAPNASQLRPVQIANNLQELLQYDYAFENELVSFYEDAARYCARSGDQDGRVFFGSLLAEEQAHTQELQQWLQQIQQ
jgi:bacterioferritin